jgi:hypothetical protein
MRNHLTEGVRFVLYTRENEAALFIFVHASRKCLQYALNHSWVLLAGSREAAIPLRADRIFRPCASQLQERSVILAATSRSGS